MTHVGLRDGLWRRCAAHCSHQRGVAKLLSLSVETYGTEMGSLLADDITHVLKIEFDCRLRAEVPRDGCVLLSWTRALHQGGSQIRRVGKLLAPVRRYSVRIGGSVLSSHRYHPADHVRDDQRARRERGDVSCFAPCAPPDARQASCCTLVTACRTRIASCNLSFNFWSSRPHGVSDEDPPTLRSDVPMLFFRCVETHIL